MMSGKIDGMNIFREEVIRKHREMWSWIAEQYENELDGLDVPVNHLKAKFVKNITQMMNQILCVIAANMRGECGIQKLEGPNTTVNAVHSNGLLLAMNLCVYTKLMRWTPMDCTNNAYISPIHI